MRGGGQRSVIVRRVSKGGGGGGNWRGCRNAKLTYGATVQYIRAEFFHSTLAATPKIFWAIVGLCP